MIKPKRQHKTVEPQGDSLKVVPLGGLEEVGRNMMYLEYKDEIVLIDAGLQFPEEDTPGIDFIIPNVSSLESKKENIQALFLTHAHYDHIGALPYIIEKLGNPTIYTTALTKAIIEKRQEEVPNAPKLKIEVVKPEDKIQISRYFEVQLFPIEHNVPDTFGMVLKTPIGNFCHIVDFKIDRDENDNFRGLEMFKKVGEMGIHTLSLDSTSAEIPGYTVSERVVEKNIEDMMKKAKGRIIIAMFASLLGRIAEIIKIAERQKRYVAISGTSMKNNVTIAQNLGYLKIKKQSTIPIQDIHKYRDEQLLILCTGAQGEPNASLMKISNAEHRFIKIKPSDTVVFSASVIPGNERAIQTLKDNLARQGAIIHQSAVVDFHSSGHAPQEELKEVMRLIKPKFFMPTHGYYFMRYKSAELATEVGIPQKNCILADNGEIIKLTKDAFHISKETVPAYYVMVDGLGVGDVEEVVMRDRRSLSQEGMVVIIITLNRQNGSLLKNPDIISRGFIYLKENKDFIEDLRNKIKHTVMRIPHYQPIEADYLKSLIREQIGQFLYTKTKRRPVIIPVVIEV
ncbi:MAG: ribonuclease J [Candidatus Paceibacterota bacterium]|jgi:ribonuclease J